MRVREAAGAVEMAGIAHAIEVGARAGLGGRTTGTVALVVLAANARRSGVLALVIRGAGVRALALPEPGIARQLARRALGLALGAQSNEARVPAFFYIGRHASIQILGIAGRLERCILIGRSFDLA